jgi:CBS domain containing-hemolysin-like protein
VLLVAINAFFVAAEFAMVAADRSRLEADAGRGDRRAARTLVALRNLSDNLSACQIGITVSSLVLGFLTQPVASRALEPLLGTNVGLAALIGLLLGSVFQMVLGELVPKSLAISSADSLVLVLGWPTHLFGRAVRPFVRTFNGNANRIVRRLGVEPRDEIEVSASVEELAFIVRSSAEEGTLEPGEVDLLTRSIRFGEKTAAEVLVPRVEVEAVGVGDTVEDLVRRSVRTGHSRFPVVDEGLDDVVGVVHVKEAARLSPAERATTPVSAVMTEVLAVPESRDLELMFADMQRTRNQLVIVVDEHGGTAGIVTVEDILEEIVGEIDDEYDRPPASLTKVEARGSYVVSASLHRDEVREACGFELPDGDYETLAGFVLERLGHLPSPGEIIRHDGWRIEVVAMDRRRIATVRVVDPLRGAVPVLDRRGRPS